MALKVIFDEILRAILDEEKAFKLLGMTAENAFESACSAIWESGKYEVKDFHDVKGWLINGNRKKEHRAFMAQKYNEGLKNKAQYNAVGAYGGMREEFRNWVIHQMAKEYMTEEKCKKFLKTVEDPVKKQMAQKYLIEHGLMKQLNLFDKL